MRGTSGWKGEATLWECMEDQALRQLGKAGLRVAFEGEAV